MGVRRRIWGPRVRGPSWVAYLPGRPYGRQAAFLRFLVLTYSWPPTAASTLAGLLVRPLSQLRHVVLFDMSRTSDASRPYVLYDLQTKDEVVPDLLLSRFIEMEVLPACFEHLHPHIGDEALEEFAALVPRPFKDPWFSRAIAPMELGSAKSRRQLEKLKRLASTGRAQRTPREVVGDSLARYNRGYLQWARRMLKGRPRDSSYVKDALVDAEHRAVPWSKDEHELHVAIYRRVFHEEFVTTLRGALITNPPPRYTLAQLEQGFVMNILELLEKAYAVSLNASQPPVMPGVEDRPEPV